MAPNKFEKHIKKELQEREIQPSASAWESLSERLTDETSKPKKRGYFWYGMAASFIGVLIVSIMYFNAASSANTTVVKIVDTTDETFGAKVDSEMVTGKDIEETVVENDKINASPTNVLKTTDKSPILELKVQIATVGELNMVKDSAVEKAVMPNDFKEEIINTKILEIVAAVDSLEQNNTALTDAEVNNLLRNAQEEILGDKLFSQNGSVDAMALLTEVEDELDQSFRDQIFESLKTGFLKVRTAVADRNK